jgi:hypothetical protein
MRYGIVYLEKLPFKIEMLLSRSPDVALVTL